MYNHPTLIDDRNPIGKIELSNKSGLPLGVLPDKAKKNKNKEDDNDSEDSDDNISVTSTNFGEKRNRNETPDEKRERKKIAKEMKRVIIFYFFIHLLNFYLFTYYFVNTKINLKKNSKEKK